MRLQDELSKLWAFGTNTNTNIMKVYGQSPSEFYSRPDIGLIINSKTFIDKVLGVSVWETSRQTASVNWSQLKNRFGDSLFRKSARFVEYMTNKTIVGVPVPFGSFTNTVVATFGDLTGINAARYMTTKAIAYKRGKPVDLDPETQSIEDATAKMMLGWSWIVWRTFHGENSAVNKVSEGRTFNQNRNEAGELRDTTYDWPLNQPDLIAQMIAHGLTGDGRDLKKDLHELRNNPDEFIKYVHENFNVNNIPTELYTRLALELTGSATRQADKVERYFGTQWLEFMDGLQGEDLKIALGDFLIGMIADGGAYIFQGATRFAEPYSVVGNMVFHEGNVPDLRQGNERWNLATKYINGLLPDEAFTLFGTTYGSSLAEEKRATLTEGLDRNVNVSKMLFGARRSPNLSVGQTMLNAAGIPSWKYNRWGGDPIVKNHLDILAAPEFEATAIEYLHKYPSYFNRNLKEKERILKLIREDFRARVLNKLKKFSPQSMNLLKEVTSGDKEAMNFALNSLRQNNEIGADDDFDDIMKKENVVEILQHLKRIMDNYDDITFPQPLDKEVTNMLSPRYQ
jgi:hypothetical protein